MRKPVLRCYGEARGALNETRGGAGRNHTTRLLRQYGHKTKAVQPFLGGSQRCSSRLRQRLRTFSFLVRICFLPLRNSCGYAERGVVARPVSVRSQCVLSRRDLDSISKSCCLTSSTISGTLITSTLAYMLELRRAKRSSRESIERYRPQKMSCVQHANSNANHRFRSVPVLPKPSSTK